MGGNACQAWAVLEAADGNTQLARQLFRCAVKADPGSEPSWLVRSLLCPLIMHEVQARERRTTRAGACAALHSATAPE